MSHFNTGPGLPQTRAEVDTLTDEGLEDFMAFCGVEPADFDSCLACYAYGVAQDREAKASALPSPAAPTIPVADLWAALGRKSDDLAPYLADHGAEAVSEELLRSVRNLRALRPR